MYDLSRIDTVADILTDATLKATLLLFAACLTALVFRRSSAAFQHRLWSLTLLGTLLLPLMSWLLPAWQIAVLPVERRLEPTLIPSTASVRGAIDEPNRDEVITAPAASVEPRPQIVHAVDPSRSFATETSLEFTPSQWLVAGWMFGGLVSLAFLARGWWRARAMIRRSRIITDEPWQQLLKTLQHRLRLRRRIELREGADAVVPLTWGIVRPVVLIPSTSAAWSDALKQSVLLHELLHIQRGDIAYQLAGRLACVVYWFHPLAWSAMHRLRHDREQACDDAVVHTGEKASDYAGHLLEIARQYRYPHGLSLAIEMARPGKLEQRLQAMFDERRSHRPLRRWLGILLCLLIIGATTGVAVFEPVGEIVFAVASDEAPASEEGREELPGRADVRLGGMKYRLAGLRKYVALLDNEMTLLGSSEQGVRIWKGTNGNLILPIDVGGAVLQSFQLSTDRKHAIVGGPISFRDGQRVFASFVASYEIVSGRLEWRIESPDDEFGGFNKWVVTPDGRTLIAARFANGQPATFSIFDTDSGTLVQIVEPGVSEVVELAMSPDGKKLAVSALPNKLYLCDWPLKRNGAIEMQSGDHVEGLAFSPDNRLLAAGTQGQKNMVQIFDLVTKEKVFDLDPSVPFYTDSLVFSPDSRNLFAANAVNLAKGEQVSGVFSWNIQHGELTKILRVPNFRPRKLALSPDGRTLAATESSTKIHLWDVATNERLTEDSPAGHTDFISGMGFVGGTDRIVTTSSDRSERLWQSTTGEEIRMVKRDGWIAGLAISHDARIAATSGHDNQIRIWQTKTGEVLHQLEGYGFLGGLHQLAFTEDDARLLTIGGSPLRTVRVWDVTRGELSHEYVLGDGQMRDETSSEIDSRQSHWTIALHRTGEIVVVATNKSIAVYDALTGKERVKHEIPFGFFDMSISPDGKELVAVEQIYQGEEQLLKGGWGASGEQRFAIVCRDLKSGAEIWRIESSNNWSNVAYSSKGDIIAVATHSDERPVQFLDSKTGKVIVQINGSNPAPARNSPVLIFSPDDRWLASAQRDHTILIWDFEKLRREKIGR